MPNNYPFHQRLLAKRLAEIFSKFSCVVLSGARQVGKSTLLENLFPNIKRIVFDPVHDIQNARQDPDLFLNNNPPPLILDEIQYAPELIPIIKRKIDELKAPGLYILTGSQQWGVLKQISESLAGRAILMQLEGFSLSELSAELPDKPWMQRYLESPSNFFTANNRRLKAPFTLYEQLWRGFLPESKFIDLDLISYFHSSYQTTYIERDIRLLSDISDIQLFGRFVKLAAALTAQEINFSQLGREIGITPQTAKNWLHTLSHAFEWFEVEAYANNSIKKVSSKPKGYFTDTGQVCFSQMISSPSAIASHPLLGAIFENAVVSELKKQALSMTMAPHFYHWRTYGGAECDLILERDGKFYPIEIKAKSSPKKTDARGIIAFREHHPKLNIEKGIIIAPSENIYALNENDWVVPWDLF